MYNKNVLILIKELNKNVIYNVSNNNVWNYCVNYVEEETNESIEKCKMIRYGFYEEQLYYIIEILNKSVLLFTSLLQYLKF